MVLRRCSEDGCDAGQHEVDAGQELRAVVVLGQLCRHLAHFDIHDYNGQLALEAADLMEEFHAITHEGGAAARVLDSRGTVLAEMPDDGTHGRPEVLRGDLHRILLDSLPAETVQWGRKVTGARSLGDGLHEVTFAEGPAVTIGLLVGADGAWSRIRPLLSDAKPHYTGTSSIETFLYDADERHPAAAKAVGGGAMYALSPGKGIIAHREAGNILHTYFELHCHEEWLAGIDFSDAAAAVARIATQLRGWAPELTALITDSDTAPVPRPIYTLPDGHRWDRTPGVTLIGDAAHLMPPSGEGANLAGQYI